MKRLTKITSVLLAVLLVVALLPAASFAAVTYTLNLPSATELKNGSVVASKLTGISAGDEITLTFNADNGYSLKGSNRSGYYYSGSYLSYFSYTEGYKYISIPAGATTFTFTMPAASVRLYAEFEKTQVLDVSVSNILIEAGRYTYNGATVAYNGAYIINGSTTANSIIVASGAPVIYLDGVSVEGTADTFCALSVRGAAAPTIVLKDAVTNKFVSGKNHAGIEVEPSASLKIRCTGCDSSNHVCGPNCGTVIAYGGQNGAGIGGGYLYSSGRVEICGGNINAACAPATSSNPAYGAGIGGGFYGNSGTIIISGGVVNANAAYNSTSAYGAGIGGGYGSSAYSITISGGQVVADAGNFISAYGAGIGGGINGNGGSVVITGGQVKALGGSNGGAGIGGGSSLDYGSYSPCGSGSVLRIEGGTVNVAGGGYYGNAIGGGVGYLSSINGASGSMVVSPAATVKVLTYSFDSDIQPKPVSSVNGAEVYLTKVSLIGSSIAQVSSVTVSGKTYEMKDVYTDEYGMLYMYLPLGSEVTAAMTDLSAYAGSVKTDSDQSLSAGVLQRTASPQYKVTAPVIYPANGVLESGGRVTITCATPGARIYYTTDGTTPTLSSQRYVSAFTVSAGTTVKAVAYKAGMISSDVTTVTYNLFTSVSKIIGVPTICILNTPLTLTGQIYPATSSSSFIVWSISPKNTNKTAKIYNGNRLYASTPGLVTVRATVYYGSSLTEDYSEDFCILATPASQGDVAPMIIKNPEDVQVGVGSVAIFSVSAVGTSPFTYQWQKIDTRSGYSWVDIPGANSEVYTIPAVTVLDNSTRYRCVISNVKGSTASYPALLTVNRGETPVITTQTMPNAVVNTPYEIKLSATGADPLIWSLASGTMPEGLTLSADGIIKGTPTKAGNYVITLRVVNYYSVVVKTLTLTVDEKSTEQPTDPEKPTGTPTVPVITSDIGSLSNLKPGDSAVLYIAATAEVGTVSYQWYKNGEAIEGATDNSYTVSNVSAADDGDYYYAIITSTVGTDSRSALSTLRVLKVIQNNPQSCDN